MKPVTMKLECVNVAKLTESLNVALMIALGSDVAEFLAGDTETMDSAACVFAMRVD